MITRVHVCVRFQEIKDRQALTELLQSVSMDSLNENGEYGLCALDLNRLMPEPNGIYEDDAMCWHKRNWGTPQNVDPMKVPESVRGADCDLFMFECYAPHPENALNELFRRIRTYVRAMVIFCVSAEDTDADWSANHMYADVKDSLSQQEFAQECENMHSLLRDALAVH